MEIIDRKVGRRFCVLEVVGYNQTLLALAGTLTCGPVTACAPPEQHSCFPNACWCDAGGAAHTPSCFPAAFMPGRPEGTVVFQPG